MFKRFARHILRKEHQFAKFNREVLISQKNYFNSIPSDCIYNNPYNQVYYGFARQSFNYYLAVAPFFHSVNKIANAIGQIELKTYNKSDDMFYLNSDLQYFLENPNSMQTRGDFMVDLSSCLAISGNAFINVVGEKNKQPQEMWVINPQYVSIGVSNQVSIYGYPQSYCVTMGNVTNVEFNMLEVLSLDKRTSVIRYFNDQYGELYHIKEFNPRNNSNNVFGISNMTPLMLELEQYYAGNLNNKSLLQNGMRGDFALINNTGESWTDDQFESLKQTSKAYTGVSNTGKMPILDGADIKSLTSTNKDMQFQELQKFQKETIYNIFNIPLAMVSSQTMTYNNVSSSQLSFYDNAVLPLLHKITANLTRMLLYRFPKEQSFSIYYSQSDIPALESRALQNAQLLQGLNICTMNELRTLVGYDRLTDGGDYIRDSVSKTIIAAADGVEIPNNEQPNNEQPVNNTTSNNNDDEVVDETENNDSKRYFIEQMRKQLKADGLRRFSDKEIIKRWSDVVRRAG